MTVEEDDASVHGVTEELRRVGPRCVGASEPRRDVDPVVVSEVAENRRVVVCETKIFVASAEPFERFLECPARGKEARGPLGITVEVLFALYGYAVRIYCDFSGYTDSGLR